MDSYLEAFERENKIVWERVDELEKELHSCFHRIEELQTALREIAAASKVIVKAENMAQALVVVLTSHRKIALAALEDKQ